MATSPPPNRWLRIEHLFYAALELAPEARPEFLDNNCEGDAELRKEVEALLDSSDQPMDFLQKPVLEAARRLSQVCTLNRNCSLP